MFIAIDWDHTLMNGKEWLPGAKEALMRLKEEGHTVIIHSCNSIPWIMAQLREQGLENVVDVVWAQGVTNFDPKPVADLYIDDRGYRFPRNGSWTEELPKVLEVLEAERNLDL